MNNPMWDLVDVSLEAEFDNEINALLLNTYFERNVDEKI